MEEFAGGHDKCMGKDVRELMKKKFAYIHVVFALFFLFSAIRVDTYRKANNLYKKIIDGQEIQTTISNGSTAPLFFDEIAGILQIDGPKILLVEACYHRNVQAVMTLLSNGADPNLFLKGRMSPIEATLWNGPAGPIDERSVEILEMLINAGADVNMHASDKSIIEQLSTTMLPDNEARESVFLLLLNYGAVEDPSESEYILHNIIRSGNINLTRKLIMEYGFDVNSIGYQGQTPLVLAIYYGQYNSGISATTDMIKTLVECNADIYAKDDYGKSALDYAIEYGYEDIVVYLNKFGDDSLS